MRRARAGRVSGAVASRRPLIAAALAAVTVTAACASCSALSSAGGSGDTPGQEAALTWLEPERRPTLGPLAGTTIDGKPVDLASYRGKVLVLNVWASWCVTCSKEAPELQAASAGLAARRDVAFLGIDTKEGGNRAGAQAFERAYGITYPSMFDVGSEALLAFRGVVAPGAVPTTLVVDPQGRVAARINGGLTRRTVVDLVGDVLSGRHRT